MISIFHCLSLSGSGFHCVSLWSCCVCKMCGTSAKKSVGIWSIRKTFGFHRACMLTSINEDAVLCCTMLGLVYIVHIVRSCSFLCVGDEDITPRHRQCTTPHQAIYKQRAYNKAKHKAANQRNTFVRSTLVVVCVPFTGRLRCCNCKFMMF